MNNQSESYLKIYSNGSLKKSLSFFFSMYVDHCAGDSIHKAFINLPDKGIKIKDSAPPYGGVNNPFIGLMVG